MGLCGDLMGLHSDLEWDNPMVSYDLIGMIAIEIVSFPTKNGDFQVRHVTNCQRVPSDHL